MSDSALDVLHTFKRQFDLDQSRRPSTSCCLTPGQICYCLTILMIIGTSISVGISAKEMSTCSNSDSENGSGSCGQTKANLIGSSVLLGVFSVGCLIWTCISICRMRSRQYERINDPT